MSAQPTSQNTRPSSLTKPEPSKQVAAIAVYVSTTVHTVTEPWSPDVPNEARSVHIYAEHPTPSRVSVDMPEEGHITVSRVGVNH